MNDDTRLTKTVRVEVPDARGKTYKFELDANGGVLIRPGSWKASPVKLSDLRQAVDELEAVAARPLG